MEEREFQAGTYLPKSSKLCSEKSQVKTVAATEAVMLVWVNLDYQIKMLLFLGYSHFNVYHLNSWDHRNLRSKSRYASNTCIMDMHLYKPHYLCCCIRLLIYEFYKSKFTLQHLFGQVKIKTLSELLLCAWIS